MSEATRVPTQGPEHPLLRLALVAVLAGCGGTPGTVVVDTDSPPAPSTTGTPTTSTPTPSPTDTTDPSWPTLPTETPSGVRGLLVGPDGTARGDAEVMACTRTTCFTGTTEPDGTFVFEVEPGTEVALKSVWNDDVEPRLAEALRPIVVDEDGAMTLDFVYQPDLPEGAEVQSSSHDPQALGVGDDLVLTVDKAALKAPFGVFLQDIAARRIPDVWVPPYPPLGEIVALAVWALHPFDTTSTAGVGVDAPCDRPDGTSLELWAIDPIDGTFEGPHAGSCEGGRFTLAQGDGPTRLTYLVLAPAP